MTCEIFKWLRTRNILILTMPIEKNGGPIKTPKCSFLVVHSVPRDLRSGRDLGRSVAVCGWVTEAVV